MAKVLVLPPIIVTEDVSHQPDMHEYDDDIERLLVRMRLRSRLIFVVWMAVVFMWMLAVASSLFVMNSLWVQEFPAMDNSVLTFFAWFGLT